MLGHQKKIYADFHFNFVSPSGNMGIQPLGILLGFSSPWYSGVWRCLVVFKRQQWYWSAELIFRLEALRAKHSQGSYYLSGYRTEDISSTIALLYTGGHQKLSLKPLVLEDLCMWTLPLKLFPSRHCFHELGSILLAPVFWDESLTQWVWYTWDTALLLINLINWAGESCLF